MSAQESSQSVITMPYVPRYPSLHRLLLQRRFVVVVAHRRFGKTTVAINHLLMLAGSCPRPRANCAYIAPLRTQAKAIAWRELKRWSATIPGRVVNESDLFVEFAQSDGTTARVRLFGADNPDALRGQYFDYVVLDEVAQMRPETWEEVVRPTLSDRHGGALFIGTPQGINLFSQLYDFALEQERQGSSEWAARCYPVTATRALPETEIADLKRDQSPNAFRQEYLCDFTASNDTALISLDEVNMAMNADPLETELLAQWPLVVGVDVGQKKDPTVVFARQGKQAHRPLIWRNLDSVEIAHRLLAYIAERKPACMAIDVGYNPGVFDLLGELARQHSQTILAAINFGSQPNSEKYRNKRVEIWVAVRDWLRDGGRLPQDEQLKAELTAPATWVNEQGRICLEAKENLRKRLGRSTDLADALALTFALPLGLARESVCPELDAHYGHHGAWAVRDAILGDDGQRRWDPFADEAGYGALSESSSGGWYGR